MVATSKSSLWLSFLQALAVLLAMGWGSTALAVSSSMPQVEDAATGALTTGAATRARADVQIRRIKMLMVTKSSSGVEQEAALDRLERLQKDLRGER